MFGVMLYKAWELRVLKWLRGFRPELLGLSVCLGALKQVDMTGLGFRV